MLVIIGKSCSGKTTVLKYLSRHGFIPIITYTTRPKRKNECDGAYHFISDEELQEKIKQRFFAEYESYKTADGVWYYGSAKKDYEEDSDKKVIILTPDGLKKVQDYLWLKPIVIYLYANNQTIMERLQMRGDNPIEARERIKRDTQAFKGIEDCVDRIVYNNKNKSIEQVVEDIVKYMNINN